MSDVGIRLEDYVISDDNPLQLDQTKPPQQRKEFGEYYGVAVELAITANSLGLNCLLVFMHIVKLANKLKRFRNFIWIDPPFAKHIKLNQRVIRRCVRKLESVGLIDASHKKGKFIKVWLLDEKTNE
jgi:GTP-sensing pleiotropic transcriptional regulator CodY